MHSHRPVAGSGKRDGQLRCVALDYGDVIDADGDRLGLGSRHGNSDRGRVLTDAIRRRSRVGKGVLPEETFVGGVGDRAVRVESGSAILRLTQGGNRSALDKYVIVLNRNHHTLPGLSRDRVIHGITWQ